MVRFDIAPERTAVIIIDMQNAFLKPGGPLERPQGRDIIPRINELLRTARAAGIMVILARHAFRIGGSDMGRFLDFVPVSPDRFALLESSQDIEFYEGLDRRDSDVIVTKRTYSAFAGTDLDLILRGNSIDTLIIGGVDTCVCCEATARDARHRNYKVIFLGDGTATRDLRDMGWGVIAAEEVQRYVQAHLALNYAEVSSVDDVISRIG